MQTTKTETPAASAAITRRSRMHKQLFLSLFVCSFLFLVASYFPDLFTTAWLGLIILVGAVASFRFLGREAAIAFGIVGIIYLALFGAVEHISTLYLHMSFLCFALYFLWPERKKLIAGCGSLPKRLGYGVLVFFILILAAVAVNLIIKAAGIDDQQEVIKVVSGLPLYLIIMAFTLGPISEELFFRAFMVPRIGVPASSILFAMTHIAYGSIAEIAGAFFLGFVLANAYYFLRDPLPCIVAHALFNLLSIILILWVY